MNSLTLSAAIAAARPPAPPIILCQGQYNWTMALRKLRADEPTLTVVEACLKLGRERPDLYAGAAVLPEQYRAVS